MTKKELEDEVKRLRGEVKVLKAANSVTSWFSPPLRTCKSCGNPYPKDYVCLCGRDNSIPNEEIA